jgi:hypothetical protein
MGLFTMSKGQNTEKCQQPISLTKMPEVEVCKLIISETASLKNALSLLTECYV